jgi:hypothetical protein
MHPDQPASPADITPQNGPRLPKPKFHGPGRPRTLDDGKLREICALIAGGCGLRDAACYVDCSVKTIRREARKNADFGQQLRHSETFAQLSPLRAMQGAVGTHWRAAAWMLERAFPERFGRPANGAFGARQARELMTEVLKIIRDENFDIFKMDRVEKRVRSAFEYHIHVACDQKRNSHSLRRAMKFFEDKDRASGTLADLGIRTPDLSDFLPPLPPRTPRDPNAKRRPVPERGRDSSDNSSPSTQTPQNNGTPSASQPRSQSAKRRTPIDDDSRPATARDAVNLLRKLAETVRNRTSPSAETPASANPNIQ